MSEDNNKIGTILRLAREEKKLSLEDISNKTKVSTQCLRNIEDNIFDEKLSTYTKGHIKLYCDVINLKYENILKEETAVETLVDDHIDSPNHELYKISYNQILITTFILGMALVFYCFNVNKPSQVEEPIASSILAHTPPQNLPELKNEI